ncbi:hypothetical protein L5515_019713 [Caenorhabditis briggsae]|uniref:Uncharacterized protein n=1 Tax=Caenorhabditis briggsae TaxID=6238 RepID=A0AAE9JTH3_CAEBR|nr:hypothetical protein L5515_019713 [Caenorhabditis briggsae]
MDIDEERLLDDRQSLSPTPPIQAIDATSPSPQQTLAVVGNQGGQGSATDMQKRERIAAASSSESNEEPKPDSSIVKSLRSKVKDLEQDKERLEEENQSLKAISSGKMLGRIEGGNLSQSKENEEFQRQDGGQTGRKFSGSKKSIEAKMPGEYFLEKERARENVHNETMNGISPEYGGEEQKFFAKPHYQSSWDMGRSSEMAMFAMMQQMRTEDRLPEPPKYTAEEKSTSLEAYHIVKVKGKEWERNVVKEPAMQNARAANNELIKLLFIVVLETSMRCKTAKIPNHVADVSRSDVILDFNNFESLGIQLYIEDGHRSIRLMRDILLTPRSQEIVEVWVEGYFSDPKCCIVHPLIDQLSASVCQVNKNGKSFLTLCNSGEDSVMLEKSQIIAQGEIKELEKLREEVSKESTEQVCSVMKEEGQEERVTRSEHIENQLIEMESMSVSRNTRNEKEGCELIGKKAVDIELCQDPPLKPFIKSSIQDCLQEDEIPDHGDLIISAELEPDKGQRPGSVPVSVNVSPDPSEKEGDVAVGGVTRTQPSSRGNRESRPGINSAMRECDARCLSTNFRDQHQHVIQEQADPQKESSHHQGVLSPGKDPPAVVNIPSEPTRPLKDPLPQCQPQYEHLNDPPKCQLQYNQGSFMSLHSKPSTSTE